MCIFVGADSHYFLDSNVTSYDLRRLVGAHFNFTETGSFMRSLKEDTAPCPRFGDELILEIEGSVRATSLPTISPRFCSSPSCEGFEAGCGPIPDFLEGGEGTASFLLGNIVWK